MRTYFVSYAWGRCSDLRRRRRLAHLRDLAAAPGRDHPDHRLGAARARDRRGGDARARGRGFLLAIGRYSIGAYLWIEAIFVVGTIAAGVVFFSRTVRRRLAFALPSRGGCGSRRRARGLRRDPRLPRPRRHAVRRLRPSRSCCSSRASSRSTRRAARSGSSSRRCPYVVLGPLLFLVMLVPFTVNGLGVREAFFVSFLGKLGVLADAAFACGFLFFVMTILLALPGLAILLGRTSSTGAAPVADGAVPDVTVVVVTWNALPWLEQCLESVRGRDVIVVDHGSTDGTLEFVRERFPEVRVIEQENRGMGGGNNTGMRGAAAATSSCSTPTPGCDGDGLAAARRVRGRASRARRSSGRSSATPTGRCSARCTASRRCGGSRPSTSSSASSRRARAC